MKKNILLLVTFMLAAVSTAWADTDYEFTAQYSNVGKLVYNGQEQTVSFSVYGNNCGYTILDNRATNVGTYTALIQASGCPGHYNTDSRGHWHIFRHVGNVSVAWTIDPRNLVDGVNITVKDQQWTGNNIQVAAGDDRLYTIKYNDQDLVLNKDYTVLVTKLNSPTTVKDEGRYVIQFTGIGNFTGAVTKTFDVKKDLSKGENFTGVHFNIPEQIYLHGQTGFDFQVEVFDNISHAKLYENEDYTMKFFDGDTEVEETAVNAGDENAKGKKYIVKFFGVAPKYDPDETKSIEKTFYVVKEYQDCDPTEGALSGVANPVNMRITKAGYPVALDSPDGVIVKSEMQVAPQPDGSEIVQAIDPESNRCQIPAGMEVTIGEDNLGYDIVGIQNNAFAGCTKLRWINSMIPAAVWTPKSLDRSVIDTPFFGIPKMTLVYLNGYSIKGENYIYKVTESDFRSELFHIYEDIKGDQTKYSDSTNE